MRFDACNTVPLHLYTTPLGRCHVILKGPSCVSGSLSPIARSQSRIGTRVSVCTMCWDTCSVTLIEIWDTRHPPDRLRDFRRAVSSLNFLMKRKSVSLFSRVSSHRVSPISLQIYIRCILVSPFRLAALILHVPKIKPNVYASNELETTYVSVTFFSRAMNRD